MCQIRPLAGPLLQLKDGKSALDASLGTTPLCLHMRPSPSTPALPAPATYTLLMERPSSKHYRLMHAPPPPPLPPTQWQVQTVVVQVCGSSFAQDPGLDDFSEPQVTVSTHTAELQTLECELQIQQALQRQLTISLDESRGEAQELLAARDALQHQVCKLEDAMHEAQKGNLEKQHQLERLEEQLSLAERELDWERRFKEFDQSVSEIAHGSSALSKTDKESQGESPTDSELEVLRSDVNSKHKAQ